MRLTCQSKVRENLLAAGKDDRGSGKRKVENVTTVSTCSRMWPVQVHSLYDSRALSAVGRPEADKPCIDEAEEKGSVTNADRVRGRGDKMRSCPGVGWRQGSGWKTEEKRNWYIVREEWADVPVSDTNILPVYPKCRCSWEERTLSLSEETGIVRSALDRSLDARESFQNRKIYFVKILLRNVEWLFWYFYLFSYFFINLYFKFTEK